MRDPFVVALDALYGSSMATTADYTPVAGPPRSVRVIRSQPTVDTGFGSGGGMLQDTNVIEVRRSEIAQPATGDRFFLDAGTFRLDGAPMLDVEGLQWRFGVVPA